jgi:diguanylate cyclase (GGDEF)-like protein/putative nucleotidyltransferase with HDIG domain
MKDLLLKARIYIFTITILGIFSAISSFRGLVIQNLWMTLALSCLGALALIFKVEGATERSHYNISFVVYMFALFTYGAPTAVLVLMISHIVEWVWHKYPWYIQTFNISQFIIAMFISDRVIEVINPYYAFTTGLGIISVLVALVVFTLANHFFVGIALWFARGEDFKQSGIFDSFSLVLDYSMQIMGFVTALIWSLSPYGVVAVFIILYLTYTTLKVPSLERKTEIDSKTKLFNAKYFARALEKELERANRFDRPLTVIMGDLDLLRNINNTYGHLAGDEVLIGVANILKSSVREYDTVARFGGEEFAILMPETRAEEAYDHIEQIRKKVTRAEFTVDTSITPIKASISFGIAEREAFDQTPNDIVHNADVALYHAKSTGRNRCIMYSETGFESIFGKAPYSGKMSLDERISPAGEKYESSELRKPLKNNGREAEENTREVIRKNVKPPKEIVQNGEEPITVKDTKRKERPAWMMNVYIGGIVALSITLFGLVLKIGPVKAFDIVGFIFFAALVFIAEWFSIEIYHKNTSISTSAVPLLGGILLMSPIEAVGLCFIYALAATIKHKSPWSRLVYNFGNQLLAGMIYSLLLQIIGTTYSEMALGFQFLFCLLAAGIVYFITTVTIAYAIAISHNQSPTKTWEEKFRWLAPYFLALGLVAFGLTFGYQYAGYFGVVVIIMPIYFLRFSQQQFIDRTKDMVKQLRETNAALEQRSGEIEKLNEDLLQSISYVVDMHNPNLYGHSNQVVNYAVKIAGQLKLPPARVELVRKAAILHDIGKLGIPDDILSKPTKLTAEEYEIMKLHPVIGEKILKRVDSLKSIAKIVLHHHERYDGMGYPKGIKAEEIPLESRIIGLADAVEAMASDRPYRKAQDRNKIVLELQKNRAAQFDPQVVDAFLKLIEINGYSMLKNSALEANGFVKAIEILRPVMATTS